MRMFASSFLAACIFIAPCTSTLVQQAVVQINSPEKNPDIAIDGSLHPELITDDQALHIWLVAASGVADSSPDRESRMKIKVSAVGLNLDDSTKLLATVHSFGEGQRLIVVASSTLSDATSLEGKQQRAQLFTRATQLYTTAKTQIYAGISTDGSAQFAKHLLHVKQHMRIGPGRNMNGIN